MAEGLQNWGVGGPYPSLSCTLQFAVQLTEGTENLSQANRIVLDTCHVAVWFLSSLDLDVAATERKTRATSPSEHSTREENVHLNCFVTREKWGRKK
jgi:hypothetical protein